MKLVIVHYHLRPGGVRRIIELATAHLIREWGRGNSIESVLIASGEKPDDKWEKLFCEKLSKTPVEFFIDPAIGYFSEQKFSARQIERRLQIALKKLLDGFSPDNVLIWAHNLGIGRNILLTSQLTQACARRKLPLALHHHDWWFDNRWLRWPEICRAGFRTLPRAARAIFSNAPGTRHLTINSSDALLLRRNFPRHAHWIPNLIEHPKLPSARRTQKARHWLRNITGRSSAPIWILPCRGLRRKNIAEALLLTRWLRPEAWLVITGGASSLNEQSYFEKISAAASDHRWRLRLGILRGDETRKPSVAELLAASEVVLLTSIQEGFGLPYLEAAAARRPLIARSLPNIAPDLAKLGFNFPQYYRDILIHTRLFDWKAEKRRQTKLFADWRQNLPRPVQPFVGVPSLLASASPRSVPFSRLTLTAQLEVLAQPVDLSWSLCAPLNPFLSAWRKRAQAGALRLTGWPPQADDWLSGPAYAKRFSQIFSRRPKQHVPLAAGPAAQSDFLRSKLEARNLFPLLWSTQT